MVNLKATHIGRLVKLILLVSLMVGCLGQKTNKGKKVEDDLSSLIGECGELEDCVNTVTETTTQVEEENIFQVKYQDTIITENSGAGNNNLINLSKIGVGEGKLFFIGLSRIGSSAVQIQDITLIDNVFTPITELSSYQNLELNQGEHIYLVLRLNDYLKSVEGIHNSKLLLTLNIDNTQKQIAVDLKVSVINGTIAYNDFYPPLVPKDIVANVVSTNQIDLSWSEPFDPGDSGIDGYMVYRENNDQKELIASLSKDQTSFSVTGLNAGIEYKFVVQAIDKAGNKSNLEDLEAVIIAETFQSLDKEGPNRPSISVQSLSHNQIKVYINQVSDNGNPASGVKKYRVFRKLDTESNYSEQNTIDIDHAEDSNEPLVVLDSNGLIPNTFYTYMVKAIDNADNMSFQSVAKRISTLVLENTNVLTPPVLTFSVSAPDEIQLEWGAGEASKGIKMYKLYRDGALIKNFNAENERLYFDEELSASTNYKYKITVVDNDDNESSYSNEVDVSTGQVTDTTPPGIPGNFAQNLDESTSSSIRLTWNNSLEPDGVRYYEIHKMNIDGNEEYLKVFKLRSNLKSHFVNYYDDISISEIKSFKYKIRARNRSGLYSDFSNIIMAEAKSDSTDSRVPTIPQNLMVSMNEDKTSVKLDWDDSHFEGNSQSGSESIVYEIVRHKIEAGNQINPHNFSNIENSIFYDETALSNQKYSYQVRAVNKNNQSIMSSYSLVKEFDVLHNDVTPPVIRSGELVNLRVDNTGVADISTCMKLKWDAVYEDPESQFTYEVTWGSTGKVENISSAATEIQICNLQADTEMTCFFRAVNSVGLYSATSSSVNHKTSASTTNTSTETETDTSDNEAPTIPSNLMIDNEHVINPSISALLKWDSSTDNVSTFIVYKIRWMQEGSERSVQTSSTEKELSGLAAGETYTFKVSAKDEEGNMSGEEEITHTTSTPPVAASVMRDSDLFNNSVYEYLENNCLSCHGENSSGPHYLGSNPSDSLDLMVDGNKKYIDLNNWTESLIFKKHNDEANCTHNGYSNNFDCAKITRDLRAEFEKWVEDSTNMASSKVLKDDEVYFTENFYKNIIEENNCMNCHANGAGGFIMESDSNALYMSLKQSGKIDLNDWNNSYLYQKFSMGHGSVNGKFSGAIKGEMEEEFSKWVKHSIMNSEN